MKGYDVFMPIQYEECNTTLHEEVKKYRLKNAVPEWVNYVRNDSDGSFVGFETRPIWKYNCWNGGNRWVTLT